MVSTETERFLRASFVRRKRLNRKAGTELKTLNSGTHTQQVFPKMPAEERKEYELVPASRWVGSAQTGHSQQAPTVPPPRWEGDMILLASPFRRQTASPWCPLVWLPGQDAWSPCQEDPGQPSAGHWDSRSSWEHWVKLLKPGRFCELPGMFALCDGAEVKVG